MQFHLWEAGWVLLHALIRVTCISPVFFCQFYHHGRELIEHKYTRETLVSNEPISNFLMPSY